MYSDNAKTINGMKREALDTILGAAHMLYTININRADANIDLFNAVVTELACSANELILLANAIEKDRTIKILMEGEG